MLYVLAVDFIERVFVNLECSQKRIPANLRMRPFVSYIPQRV